jgi:hypothetical protein
MTQPDMNALTALSFVTQGYERNTMIVEASSDGGASYSVVFCGQIVTAQPDYTSAPDVFMRVTARTLFFESLAPATAASYTGATDVATIVQNLAAAMGYAFENNGVTAQLDSPYFANTYAEQLRTVAQHAGIDVYIDGQTAPVTDFSTTVGQPGNNVIAICPRGQPRNVPVWELSPQTGLVGYPIRESQGYIRARTLFNPAYRFGGLVNLQNSGLANSPTGGPAYDVNTGKWLISTVNHTLESLKFGGSWFSDLLCYPPGSVAPVT